MSLEKGNGFRGHSRCDAAYNLQHYLMSGFIEELFVRLYSPYLVIVVGLSVLVKRILQPTCGREVRSTDKISLRTIHSVLKVPRSECVQ